MRPLMVLPDLKKHQAEIEKINHSDKDDETKQKEVEQLQVRIQQITITDTLEISSKAAALFER